MKLVTRYKGIEYLLFFALMMIKLVLFDRYVHVPYMAMDGQDVLIALGTLALLCFWTLWLPHRGRILALVVLNVLLTVIIYADLIYFRYFQDIISIPVLTQAGQVSSLGESIQSLLAWKDIWLFADWLLIVPYAGFVLLRKRKTSNDISLSFVKPNKLRKIMIRLSLSLIVFATGLTLVFVPVSYAQRTWALGLFTGNWWNMSLYNVTGVIGFHGYDLYRYAEQHWLKDNKISDEEIQEARQWFQDRGSMRKQLEQDSMFGRYKGANVIMIQLEAFQNFLIGQKVDGQEVTPNMNKLIGESLYFKNFYHQTAQGRTSDADLAANISLHPLPSGSVFIRFAQNRYDSMPDTLKDNGYATGAFHAYDGGFWNRNAMYSTLNYDKFYSTKSFTIDEPLGWSLGDRSFFQQSVDLMLSKQQPFYSFMVSLSSHHPYTLPASVQTLDVGEFKGTIFGDYLEAAHYVDDSLGDLMDRLKAEHLWDKSIFLFYGDHDNSIKEWEPFEKFLGRSLTELDRINIPKQVPLIVHLPDGAKAGTYEQVGGQLDAAPTVLHLLGISTADKTMAGMPLITDKPLAGKKVVFRNGGYTDGSQFYMPSDDYIAEHAQCLDVTTGQQVAPDTCKSGADEARQELIASDRVIEHNLIKTFRAER
ncbi:sulfatase [Paenibacillus nasutitermitis]|uniref:Sulfatase n=2 Tax=Paenibacillus nasutitermitis TaxID=1652958 RepID=A0A916YP33_9BACL|nr:sulfatase [Paenibacillus nasutitermitis]